MVKIKNRYGKEYTFERQGDKILWKGDFSNTRFQMKPDFRKAYNTFVADGGILSFNEFKKEDTPISEKYISLIGVFEDIYIMVDPPGGMFLIEDIDLGDEIPEFKGLVVRDFNINDDCIVINLK